MRERKPRTKTQPKRVVKAIAVNTPFGDDEYLIQKLSDIGSTLQRSILRKFMDTSDVSEMKSFRGGMNGTITDNLRIIEPPHNPDQLALLLTLNATHSRCCLIKATDTTAQGFLLKPNDEFNTGEESFTDEEKAELDKQRFIAKHVLTSSENGNGYSALSKKLLLDYESIGWMAGEVIRNSEGEILNIVHVPAREVRFTEDGYMLQVRDEKAIRFVPFGSKFEFGIDIPILDPDDNKITYFDVIKSHRARKVSKVNLVNADGLSDADENVSFKNSANEMIVVVQPHPSTTYYGVPEVISALASLNANISIEDYINQFFKHQAIPQFLITVSGVDDVDDNFVQVVNKFLRERVNKHHHSTVVLPAPEGAQIKIEKLSELNQEGGFQETRKNNQQEILIAHGMTPAQVGIIDSANLGSGSGLSQAENYKNRILMPIQKMFEDLFWNKIFGGDGQGLLAISMQFKTLDIRDLEMMRKRHDTYLRHGVMSVNEVRQELNLEPTLGGDRNFLLLANDVVFLDALEETLANADNRVNKTIREAVARVSQDERDAVPEDETTTGEGVEDSE